MSEHTREPWAFEKIEGDEKTGWEASLIPCSGVDADWHCFVTAWGLQYNDNYPQRNGREVSKANALRIVACVNACAGMTDPAAEIEKLKGQRDRAVEALKDFAEFGCRHDCNPTTRFGMKEMDRLQWAIDRFKSMDNYVIEKARAAIAEIEGGE